MIVCVCRRVSDKTIVACAHKGEGFDEIQFEHGVGTQCGQCVSMAQRIWSECHPSQRLLHFHQELAAASPQ